MLDAVYTPRRTALLEATDAAGGRSIEGIEMFLTQACEQVRLFTGRRPSEEELRRYLAGSH